jgi:hypothetical protein
MVFAISVIPYNKFRIRCGGNFEIIGEAQFEGIFKEVDDFGDRTAL